MNTMSSIDTHSRVVPGPMHGRLGTGPGNAVDCRRITAWTAAVLVVGIALHLAFCWLTGTDRDTAVITTSAAIFGPAMIGPVAQQLKNPELVLSGITAALAGLALGNYLGLLTTFALRAL